MIGEAFGPLVILETLVEGGPTFTRGAVTRELRRGLAIADGATP
jgi:hypothetical protein